MAKEAVLVAVGAMAGSAGGGDALVRGIGPRGVGRFRRQRLSEGIAGLKALGEHHAEVGGPGLDLIGAGELLVVLLELERFMGGVEIGVVVRRLPVVLL